MNGAEQHISLLHDGVLLLGASLIFVITFRRFGLGAVLGYLLAGAFIGPEGLGLVGDPHGKQGIAELGIVLLLFLVGLELSISRLWQMRNDIFGFGTAQVVLCGIALAFALHLVLGFSFGAALAVGLPLALSSTAQVLPMLQSAGRLKSPFGERAFSILLFQDLSIVPLITIIAALSRAPADPATPPGWLLAIYTVAAIVGLVLAGRFILNPLFRLIGGFGERELFVAAGLFAVLAAAAIMQVLHLSTALGAFVAGVMLADSPYRHELEADVSPFRTILLGLFFVTVGMLVDLHVVLARPLAVIGLAALVVTVKSGIIFAIACAMRTPPRQALALGLLLSQGGEFAFVLFSQAEGARLIAPEAVSLFGAVVTLSMATTPFLMKISRKFSAPPVREGHPEGPDDADQARVIIVGYGRFGQVVAQMLMARGISLTLIDSAPRQIEISQNFGAKVYYGDGTRVDLLHRAGADEAAAILFCADGVGIDSTVLKPIVESFPNATIFARAYDRRHLMRLQDAQLAGVVREVYESAVAMARMTLSALGTSDDEIRSLEEAYRRRDEDRLAQQIQASDLKAGRDLMFSPTRSLTWQVDE
jgi:glutathione-regulated potassium-efflux system protein KefB